MECAPVDAAWTINRPPLLGFRRMEAITGDRSHSAAFKRQVAEAFIAGETLACALQAPRHFAADPWRWSRFSPGEMTGRTPRPYRCDLQRVRVLRIPPDRSSAALLGRGGQRQAAPPHASTACSRSRRRYVVTTDSNDAEPIYPDLAKHLVSNRPTSFGSRTSPMSPSRVASATGGNPGCSVPRPGWLRDQPFDRCPHCPRGGGAPYSRTTASPLRQAKYATE
jgi:hypothetical protein